MIEQAKRVLRRPRQVDLVARAFVITERGVLSKHRHVTKSWNSNRVLRAHSTKGRVGDTTGTNDSSIGSGGFLAVECHFLGTNANGHNTAVNLSPIGYDDF